MAITAPTHLLKGKIRLPGSKSITNRALLIASLANGHSVLSGALKSDDTIVMANALRLMGVKIDELEQAIINIYANAKLLEPKQTLFLGNAGTATRFLTAAAGLVNGKTIIDGDEDMRKRPIEPLVKSLNSIGIKCFATNGCPPVTIQSNGKIGGKNIEIDASLSSQYVSALLIIAPMLNHEFTISFGAKQKIGGRGYIDLTLAIMREFGAIVDEVEPNKWVVQATGYKAINYEIAPDFSSCTYHWAIKALMNAELELYPLTGLENQPDAKAQEFIKQFPNMPAIINGEQMQDAIPTLAVLAAFNNQTIRFTGIANLRVKECDRIAALNNGLNAISKGLAKEDGDDLIVFGNPNLISPNQPVLINTYNDHRIAMSFALAGLKLENILIDNPNCVAKTYAKFWDDLANIGVKLDLVD